MRREINIFVELECCLVSGHYKNKVIKDKFRQESGF